MSKHKWQNWVLLITICCTTLLSNTLFSQVQLVSEIKISDKGLYFDGERVPTDQRLTYPDNPKYDYAFGRRITPHGDCIKQYGGYVFLTWYEGDESNRGIHLTRYNLRTGSTATIEFPHRHTGFQNRPHIGESHNTIAVGICANDGSIHLLYDMHAYSETRPADGSLANDYFRYQYSVDGAATLPDGEFTLDKFYDKQLYLNENENYRGLTYPRFFENNEGDLLVVLREGGHNNGKYQFAKFDGNDWTNWTDFNVLNARNQGMPHNWGLYGDMKYLHGKLRIGFHTRLSDNEDAFRLNNGFHYAYSNDPSGASEWYNYKDEPIPIPLIDYNKIKFAEPADMVSSSGANSITINRGADWTVTANEDIHFITEVIKDGNRTPVHTYKKADDRSFTTTTDFPSGSLYSIDDDIYLLNLEDRRPVFYKAQGGTNEWQEIYRATSGKQFRHGNAIIEDGKLYYYLMEMGSGSAQPIWLQVYDLGLVSSTTSTTPIVNSLKAYPNPNQHGLFQLNQAVDWQVISSTGAVLLEGQGREVDLSAFTKGVYFLRSDGEELLKLLVQ